VKLTADRPFADPEATARKLLELARSIEPVHDGRIYIEQLNAPMLFKLKGSRRLSTRQVWSLPSRAAGSHCTRAGHTSGSSRDVERSFRRQMDAAQPSAIFFSM